MIDIDTAAKIGAPLFTLIVGVIAKHYFTGRPNLISYIGHISSFTIQNQNQGQPQAPLVVNTHSVIVRNIGRTAAKNVRLAHRVMPQHISVEPPIQYSTLTNPQGAVEIVIPTLVSKEQVTVSYLYFPPITWNQVHASTKSDEGFAKIISVIPTPQPSRVAVAAIWVLVFIGMTAVFYWSFQWIASIA